MKNIKISTTFSVVLMALLFMNYHGYGEEPDLVTDRPDFTESALAVPLGSWQFEMGYTFEKNNGITNHTLGELLIRYSPIKNLEIRFGFNSFAITRLSPGSFNGLEDFQLGLKYELVAEHVAIMLTTSLPTGAEVYRSTRLQPELKLALAYDFNDFLSAGINLGIASIYEDDASMAEYSASLALGGALSEKWGIYIEYYGFYYGDGGVDQHFLNGGFTYLVNKLFQLDIRGGEILNTEDSTFYIGVGASFRF